MHPRNRKRGEHPNLPIINEQMRPSAPFLIVAIEFFQIENVLVGEAVWALLERWRRGVVQHDEGRSPTRPPQRVAIAIKFFYRMTDADNSLPSHGVNSV